MRFLKFVQTGCEFVLMHFQKKGNNIELLQMDLSTVNEGNEICGIIKTDIINTKKLRKHKTTFNQSIMPSVNKLITISFETKVQFSCSCQRYENYNYLS